MKYKVFLSSFRTLVEKTQAESLGPEGRFVFMSDLHLGDGGSRDDLAPNRGLVQNVLGRWYFERGSTLVLNGDIEDLSKFRYREIRQAWFGLYGIFEAYAREGRLRRILGNHDLGLLTRDDYPWPLLHAFGLDWKGRRIMAFHGHQASRFFVEHDYLADFIVRYLAKPLNVPSVSISHDSRHRFKTEERIYRASRRLGVLSITGHTHRPLFESLAKYDSLRFAIEELLREYLQADERRRRAIADLVEVYQDELGRLKRKDRDFGLSRSLYGKHDLLVPSLFNSGCATGKKGVTAIEIEEGNISLVQWTGAKGPRTYIEREALERSPLEGTPYVRHVLRRSSLDEVFARIELLGARRGPGKDRAAAGEEEGEYPDLTADRAEAAEA